MVNKKQDLVIDGNGSLAGGRFQHVQMNGNGIVHDDVECSRFEANGNSTVYGNVKAESVEIHGSADIKGNLEAENILIKGEAKIRDNVFATTIKIEGHTSIDGSLKGDKVTLIGKVRVDGDCEAEIFKAEGQFTIKGLLNAGSIDIKLHGESKVKEIGGEVVKVQHKTLGLIKALNPMFSSKLSVDSIEGDLIELERSKVRVVRGSNVQIGTDCEIELVEYKNDFQQNTKAKVKDSRKTG